MAAGNENYLLLINLLKDIYSELQSQSELLNKRALSSQKEFLFLPFRVSEIFLLEKAFVDAGGSPNENYKSLFEKTVPYLSNKNQKGFSAESFTKYSDKVDREAKDNVKRFLMRMIRNIDSYD
jgi:hypothetical protein